MSKGKKRSGARPGRPQPLRGTKGKRKGARLRSEERFSRNAETDLVCRLLLEKKNEHAQRRRNTMTTMGKTLFVTLSVAVHIGGRLGIREKYSTTSSTHL